jgi:ABC-type amino acid transport substrate-binding protein
VLLDTPIVLGAVEAGQVGDAEVVGQFKTGEVYGAVVNRGSKNLDAFNQVIRAMKADGTRDRLFKQYFAKQAEVPPEIPL